MSEKFLIVCDGRNDVTLFLVDRAKSKKNWWTTDTDDAIHYRSEYAAGYAAKRLRYKNPRVITETEARQLEGDNLAVLAENDTHPFDLDGGRY